MDRPRSGAAGAARLDRITNLTIVDLDRGGLDHDLGQITAFSSLTFLLVFAIVNVSAIPHSVFHGAGRALPVVGATGCLGAVAVLTLDLLRHEPTTLVVVGAIALGLLLGRGAFVIHAGGRRP